MTQQISVSKSGVNVLTATNPNDFIFSSLYNTFKILSTGTYSPVLGTTTGETFTTFSHGQSFIPFVIAFCKFANGRVGVVGDAASNADFWFTNLRVDSTYIGFGYYNNTGGNYQPVFRFYICEPPL